MKCGSKKYAEGGKVDKRKVAEEATAKAREHGRMAEEARKAGRMEEAQRYMDMAEEAAAAAYRKRRAAGEDYAEGGLVGKTKKYAKGGKVCRGSGAATRGTKFKGVF